jgi:hypothetical protein
MELSRRRHAARSPCNPYNKRAQGMESHAKIRGERAGGEIPGQRGRSLRLEKVRQANMRAGPRAPVQSGQIRGVSNHEETMAVAL